MNRWRILVVDDVPVVAENTAELLRSQPVADDGSMADVEVTTSFAEALELLEQRHYDLVILDIRDDTLHAEAEAGGAEADTDVTAADVGLMVFAEIRSRRFVPIIYYSAVAHLVAAVNPPFSAAVSKNDEIDVLREHVLAVFQSTIPAIHQALLRHVDVVTRDFMADFVEHNWSQLSPPQRKGDLAHLLLRRLALSLSSGGEALAEQLANEPGVVLEPDSVHPMRYYIVPPAGTWTTGDLVSGPRIQAAVAADDQPCGTDTEGAGATELGWYVLLTPACDLVPDRVSADYVVVAECIRLESSREFVTWKSLQPAAGEEPSAQHKTAEKKLRNLMRNRRDRAPADRDYYLPGAWVVPDLVVDFQRVAHLSYAALDGYTRVATLDSPYAEGLIQRFGRYLGRVGTPDLDTRVPLDRLSDT